MRSARREPRKSLAKHARPLRIIRGGQGRHRVLPEVALVAAG